MIEYRIHQLQKLGKKQKKFIVRKHETVERVEINSKVFGPTSEKNCKNFIASITSESARQYQMFKDDEFWGYVWMTDAELPKIQIKALKQGIRYVLCEK